MPAKGKPHRRVPIRGKFYSGRVQPPGRELELGRILLRGRGLSAALSSAITEATLEQTLEGASTLTLTLRDYRRALVRSGLVKGRTALRLDGIEYWLVKVDKSGDQLALTFEEAAVSVLRSQTGPLKKSRDSFTRAQFARLLVREPKRWSIPFRSPEINVRQPVKGQQE